MAINRPATQHAPREIALPVLTEPEVNASYRVLDVPYVNNFYPFLAPAWLDHVATLHGFAAPERRDGFHWCDLGCGLGTTAVLLAATHPSGRFLGVDINPDHIGEAKSLAHDASVANADFLATDFANVDCSEMCFDYIVAHGVFTWLGASAQAALCRFIDHHLNPGGLVCLTYNALPGWNRDLPFQRLLQSFADISFGTSTERLNSSFTQVRELLAVGVPALKDSLILAEMAAKPEDYPPHYLVHEYLVGSWRPRWVTEVRSAMAAIGLEPVGSATLGENHDRFVLGGRARAILAQIEDRDIRELARDFFLSQRFRRDVFTRRGARLGAESERRRRLFVGSFALARPSATIEYSVRTAAGRLGFDNAAAHAVVALLEDGPATLEAVARAFPACDGEDILANAYALMTAGHVRPVEAERIPVAAFNRAVFQRRNSVRVLRDLALPCGTGVRIDEALLTVLASGAIPDDNAFPGWKQFLAAHGV